LIELGGPKEEKEEEETGGLDRGWRAGEEEEEKKNGGLIGGPGESARWCFSLPGKLQDEAGTSAGAYPPRRPFGTSSAGAHDDVGVRVAARR
jgi:hypothetical protein